MEKDFVPYKLALRMKALGFDEPCFHLDGLGKVSYAEFGYGATPIPLYSQAFRWFREKHDLHAVIMPKITPSNTTVYYSYKGKIEKDWNNCFESYEEAETARLEKLIEIVESESE